MKRRFGVLGFVSVLGFLATSASSRTDAGTAARPAEWMRHDVIVALRNLPKRYSCNDLSYKFHDLLLAIGARPDMRILTYRCERGLGPNARSPRLHLTFSMLQVLPLAQTRDADAVADRRIIHVAAGHPQSLDKRDCELLRQIKDTLFASLRMHVLDFSLDCEAPEGAHPPFGLSVQTLFPEAMRPLHAQL